MGSREGRIAENEAAFRAVNERISEWPEHDEAPDTESIAFVCECGDVQCFERVYLTRRQYEEVRADSARFAVTPGHELPEVERVVDRHPGYSVVEKDESVRDSTEATDPRRDTET